MKGAPPFVIIPAVDSSPTVSALEGPEPGAPAPPRRPPASRLYPWLVGVVVLWQCALSVVIAWRYYLHATPVALRAEAAVATTFDELVMGLLLMELNDGLALTSEQAQGLRPVLDRAFASPNGTASSGPQERQMLSAFITDTLLTPAQKAWLFHERAVVRAALQRNPWAGLDRMEARFRLLVQRRAAEKTAGGPSGSGTRALTHEAFMTGLLLLETEPKARLTPEQAVALQRSLAPALVASRMTTALREAVPSDVLTALDENQKRTLFGFQGSTARVDGKEIPQSELPGLVGHLLQTRAQGKDLPRKLTRLDPPRTPGPSGSPGLASTGGAAPPAPGSGSESGAGSGSGGDATLPGVHMRGPSSLVFTQYLMGIVALEQDPKVAIDAVQAARLQPMLPEIEQALQATTQRGEVPAVMNVERVLKDLLRMDQKRFIAAHVPESGPMDDLVANIRAVIDKRLGPGPASPTPGPQPTR